MDVKQMVRMVMGHATLVAAGMFMAGGSTLAHHSFPAYYFEEQSTTVEGEVVEFKYQSPHAWVHVAVVEPSGTRRVYAAEWSNPNRLSRDGISKDTIRPRDVVRITGSPGRDEREYRLHLKRIERPSDGWRWETRRR
jgi:hypothetical protein